MSCSLNRLVAQSLPMFHRRGFATPSNVSARVGFGSIAQGHGKPGNLEEKYVSRDGPEACSAWAPDPETGYYRPINYTRWSSDEYYSKPIPDHPTRVEPIGAASYCHSTIMGFGVLMLCVTFGL